MPAATLAHGTRIREARLLRGVTLLSHGRILTEQHFEFRGGVERGLGGVGSRPRREDR